jgi:hypothetical protein
MTMIGGTMKKQNLKLKLAQILIIGATLACNAQIVTKATPTPVIMPATNLESSFPADASTDNQIVPVSLPLSRSDHTGNYDSSTTAEFKKSAGGDRFTYERFERPFNASTMDAYFPHLDIVDALTYQDDMWLYATVQVKDRSAATSSPYRFAMQLDTDIDGKGDWLVMASNPSSIEWTVVGVQLFEDANGDVGNVTAMTTDNYATGDGFELLVFDEGKGNDSDTAWVRVSPLDSNTVEFSLKRSVLGDSTTYLIDMWAGSSLLDPSLFDFSDHFTHEEAGAADPGFPVFYPIKSIYEIDNTCRMAVGFTPAGNEPRICRSIAPVESSQAGEPGQSQGPSGASTGTGTDPWDPGACWTDPSTGGVVCP